MHQADMVKLQFGHLQGILEEARCLDEHPKMTTIKARQKAYTTLYSDEQNCKWLSTTSPLTTFSTSSSPILPTINSSLFPTSNTHPHYPEQQTSNPHFSQLQTPAPYFYQNQTFNTQYPQSHSQTNYMYESQQPQIYNRPTTQFTPIMRPNFDSSSSQHNPTTPYFPTMCPPQQPQYNFGEDLNVNDYDLLESIWSPPQATAHSQENPPTSDATQQNPPTTETEQQYGFGHRALRPHYCFTGTRFGPGHQH
ncbi:unnamed protein product [Vicia faba]|uniref:Uncharacterized protein n=1 Tax=Vicia faba TaxID=3906 RepID=A0AAV1A1A3_VICFA|nr:unnamed protein product [Vicia faba]